MNAKPANPLVHALPIAAALAVSACSSFDHGSRYPTLDGNKPLIIGHRGASGYLPDHTLESYRHAIALGADFIEPDLVATKDGALISRHEPNITTTTDVSSRPEFAARKRKMTVDGVEEEGWFASDFTLAEIKTLRAVQPLEERDQSHNGRYQIPTLQEIIELAEEQSARSGKTIGIYPETKHPTYHQNLGLPLEDRLLSILNQYGYHSKTSPVIIQSFETSNLKYLRSKTRLRLVQLIDGNGQNPDGSIDQSAPNGRPFDLSTKGDSRTFQDLLTPESLAEIKTYADGIGPWKAYLIPSRLTMGADGQAVDMNKDGTIDERDRTLLAPTSVVKDAHAAGLFVHPYTFRNEARRLPSDDKGNPLNEYRRFYRLGVDGVFSDFPDTARAARDRSD